MLYNFQLDEIVLIKPAAFGLNPKGPSCMGKIKGVASTPVRLMGATFIVECETLKSEEYPFTHVCVAEYFLERTDLRDLRIGFAVLDNRPEMMAKANIVS